MLTTERPLMSHHSGCPARWVLQTLHRGLLSLIQTLILTQIQTLILTLIHPRWIASSIHRAEQEALASMVNAALLVDCPL